MRARRKTKDLPGPSLSLKLDLEQLSLSLCSLFMVLPDNHMQSLSLLCKVCRA